MDRGQEARHRLQGVRHEDGRHRLRGPDRQAKAQGAKYIVIQNVPSPGRRAGREPGRAEDGHPDRLPELVRRRAVRQAGRGGRREDDRASCRSPRRWPASRATRRSTTSSRPKGTDADAKGLHYVQGWYTMATDGRGHRERPRRRRGADRRDDQGRAGEDHRLQDRRRPTRSTSPPTIHAGLLSAPLFQVEGGVFKKIAGPDQGREVGTRWHSKSKSRGPGRRRAPDPAGSPSSRSTTSRSSTRT